MANENRTLFFWFGEKGEKVDRCPSSSLSTKSGSSLVESPTCGIISLLVPDFAVWSNPLRNTGIFIASPRRFVAPGVRRLSSGAEKKPCAKKKEKYVHRKLVRGL